MGSFLLEKFNNYARENLKFIGIISIVLFSMKTSQNKKVDRSVTNINMQWLTERVRKAAKIKKQILDNQYNIDSKSVVSAMLNLKSNSEVERDLN